MVSLVIVFSVLAAVFSANRPVRYVATSSLVLQDPSGVGLFSTARSADAERYVSNQVALLRSSTLAERASEVAAVVDPQKPITPGQFVRNSVVSVTSETEFVEIEFESGDPAKAQLGADSIAIAYQDTVQERLEGEITEARGNLDNAIDGVLARVASLQEKIDDLRTNRTERAILDNQVSEIASELASLRGADLPAEDKDVRVRQLAEELRARILIGELELQQGPVVVLLQQQADALELLSDLYSQRSQVELDAGLAGNGVELFSPAGPGQPKGISWLTSLIIGGALGGMLGAAVAYGLESRSWRFADHTEPERVLNVPALAIVPDFSKERLESRLPARDAPASASAESFRFLTVAIDRKHLPGQRHRSVAIVSATVGEGKTTVVANTALAAAREGLNVLVFDADIGKADLTSLLLNRQTSGTTGLGLTDIVVGGQPFENAVNIVNVRNGPDLSVLGFGRTHVDPISFFRSAETKAALASVTARFDLLLIDIPPVLHVAYATPLFSFVDDVVVVVMHGGDSAQLSETRDRLDLLGVAPSGYVYNRAPLRIRTPRVGSLAVTPPNAPDYA